MAAHHSARVQQRVLKRRRSSSPKGSVAMSKTLLTGLLGTPRSHRPSWNRSSPKTAPPRGVQTRSTPLGRLYVASTTYLPEERRLDAKLEAEARVATLLAELSSRACSSRSCRFF